MKIEDHLVVDAIRANVDDFVKRGLNPRFERILDAVKDDFKELVEEANSRVEESKRKKFEDLEFDEDRIREIYEEVINEVQD